MVFNNNYTTELSLVLKLFSWPHQICKCHTWTPTLLYMFAHIIVIIIRFIMMMLIRISKNRMSLMKILTLMMMISKTSCAETFPELLSKFIFVTIVSSLAVELKFWQIILDILFGKYLEKYCYNHFKNILQQNFPWAFSPSLNLTDCQVPRRR